MFANTGQTRFATTDDSDPDRIIVCPYDEVHLVGASRMARHLIRCRKNHPQTSFKTCCFNAGHVVSDKEYEYHVNTCPDKRVIKQDTEEGCGMAIVLPTPERNDHLIPDCDEEDWDNDTSAAPFITSSTLQGGNLNQNYNDASYGYGAYQDDQFGFNNGDYDHVEEVEELSNQLSEIELVPEKPVNWDSMTQAQRKNHKRKYRRQQERLKEAGLEIVDNRRPTDPKMWTEEEREVKLKSICSKYAIPGRGGGTFQDYKSILNQYCQKNRLNIPIYKEATADSPYGGFAAECIVKSEVYKSHGYFKTKKEAGHAAAQWALLNMEIPNDDDSSVATVRMSQTGADTRVRREGDETRRLLEAGYIGPSAERKVVRSNPVGQQSPPSMPPLEPHTTNYAQNTAPPSYTTQTQDYNSYAMQPTGVIPQPSAWNQPHQVTAQNAVNPAPRMTGAPPASAWNQPPPIRQPTTTATGQQPPVWNTGRSAASSQPPPQQQPTWNSTPSTSVARPPPGFGPTPTATQESFPPLSSTTNTQEGVWQSAPARRRPFGRGRGTTLAKSVY